MQTTSKRYEILKGDKYKETILKKNKKFKNVIILSLRRENGKFNCKEQ